MQTQTDDMPGPAPDAATVAHGTTVIARLDLADRYEATFRARTELSSWKFMDDSQVLRWDALGRAWRHRRRFDALVSGETLIWRLTNVPVSLRAVLVSTLPSVAWEDDLDLSGPSPAGGAS